MEPEEFAAIIKEIQEAAQICGHVSYDLTESEKASLVFRRSIFAVQDIAQWEVFTEENVRIIRPAYGLPPKKLKELLGHPAECSYSAGVPIFSLE